MRKICEYAFNFYFGKSTSDQNFDFGPKGFLAKICISKFDFFTKISILKTSSILAKLFIRFDFLRKILIFISILAEVLPKLQFWTKSSVVYQSFI